MVFMLVRFVSANISPWSAIDMNNAGSSSLKFKLLIMSVTEFKFSSVRSAMLLINASLNIPLLVLPEEPTELR